MKSNVLTAPPVNNVRTVSDTKRTFYNSHTRPINAIYRRVVEELMVEMHLLSVGVESGDSPIYDLGVVTSFERFMEGYMPETDKASIFNAICQAVESDPNRYPQQAASIKANLEGLSLDDLKAQFEAAKTNGGSTPLEQALHAVASNDKFKYSRLFAIGLYTLVETVDASALDEKDARNELLTMLAKALSISDEKVLKDLELYRSNLDKMVQAQEVMKDILEASRKKREQRANAKTDTVASSKETDAGDSEQDTTENSNSADNSDDNPNDSAEKA